MTFGGGMTTQNGSASRPLGAAGAERARLLPKRGDAAFDRGGVERFFHHLATPGTALAERGASSAPGRLKSAGAPEAGAKNAVPSVRSATAAPA